MYTATYNIGNWVDNPYMEVQILLPDMPPEHEMRNYGIPKEDQVWQREKIPAEYRSWPWQKKKSWADEMWHKRWNGEWWLINGEPVYVTGTAFVFFNFWHIGTRKLPDFKIQCVWWFQAMRFVETLQSCFGMVEIKPRRAHSTEMSLCWGWDIVTKYRDSKFGIMSKSDDDAAMAFDRCVFGAMRMHHVFKPKNAGSDRPQAQIEYQYPAKRIGAKNIEDVSDENETPALNSKIWFEPTVEGKFDGEKLRAALFDEIGKIPVSKMSVTYQWEVMRECLSLDVRTRIIGKAILPSTIEEMDNGKSLEVVQLFWNTSDPKVLDETGRTISGCLRMFRPYWIIAPIDKYGYPMAEEARRVRNAQLQSYEEAGMHEEAADFRRRYPETVEEALAPPIGEASIPTELIDKQLKFINESLNSPHRAIRGNLEWVDGQFGGNVRWMPNPKGRWLISRHPENPNARKMLQNGRPAPGNSLDFGMGVDPVDHLKPKVGGSNGAFCVGMMPNLEIDREMQFDEHDILLTDGMVTDSCACTYNHRTFRPEEFYEDALMTAIYFGCRMLVEYNKPGIVNWGNEKGFGAYYANKPVNADSKWMRKGAQEEVGISATPATIDNYYRHLRSHMIRRWKNYTHAELLNDLRLLTPDNRTDRDLSVSWGWCLTQMYGLALARKKKRRGETPEASTRRSLPLSTY